MTERIDTAQLAANLQAELFESGNLALIESEGDPFLLTTIEMNARAATRLFDFLLLHQERLIRWAKEQEDTRRDP